MPEATGRGITVTEIAGVDQPIDVAPETTAAVIGRALRGPLDTPVLVRNPGEFRRRFGGSWSRSSLGPAVRDFFKHGGRQLYVVRVANNARGCMLCLPAAGSALVLRAVEPGSTERLRAAVDLDGINPADTEHFNLTVQRLDPQSGRVVDQEMFRALSPVAGTAEFVVDRLLGSELVRVEEPWPVHRPDPTLANGNRYAPVWVEPVQAGSDGSELSDYDLVGSRVRGTGLFALEPLENLDLLYLPPRGKDLDNGPAAILAAELYCRRRGAMLIVDPATNWATSQDAVDGIRALGYASPNLVTYFPRLRPDAAGGRSRAAGAALAGLLCRLDRRHGPWRAFADEGIPLRAELAPCTNLDEEDAGLLARSGINAIVRDARGQLRLCGGRTLARGSESHRMFKSLAVRRTCLRMINSIDCATRWSVFEKADGRLVARIRDQVRDYLERLRASGALASDDYLVLCDGGSAATERAVRRGITLLLLFQPHGCNAPVTLTLHQSPAGCHVSSSVFAPLTAICA